MLLSHKILKKSNKIDKIGKVVVIGTGDFWLKLLSQVPEIFGSEIFDNEPKISGTCGMAKEGEYLKWKRN